MAKRFELNEESLNQVVGGKFWYNTYTNDDGSEYMTCRVDGAGTYYCSDNAKKKITAYIMENSGCNLDEVVNWALDNGYFWN